MGKSVGRAQLRTQLLVGVAAAALAAPVAGKAQAQSAGKFAPYVEAGGMVGTHSFGDVDIFIPVWQDQTSVLFGDLRGTFSAQPTEEGNFGLGYRTQVSPEWILGGYGYFDIANSPNDNLFYQITLGVELKSVDWDFRLNGYIPINPDGGSVNKNSNPDIHINGNTIKMTTESRDEKALYGFDGEVGWRIPVFPADGDFDIRVYAGGYYFTNGDVDTIAGPRGRIEARLYDIDFLGLQSRLTAQGVIQWDQPRGTQGWGGLELRIPLGAITGSAGPKLNPLDRRMVDRVVRDIDIVTEKTQPKTTSEDVIVDELTVSTHTIVFANSGGAGSGAKGKPIDLNQAPGKGQTLGSNAIILADGGAGDITITNPLQLQSGQALIGGGSVVPLTGAKTGKTVDFKFAGSRPTLVGTNSDKDLVDMAPGSQNEVFGLNMTGAMYNAVFGLNMQRAIVKNNLVDPPAGNGFFFLQQATTNYGGPQLSSFVHAESNTVVGAGIAGIAVVNLVSDGNAHAQTVVIDRNTVTSNGGEGIAILNEAAGVDSSMSQSLAIRYNVISGNGIVVSALAAPIQIGVVGNGILLDNAVYSGATLTQSAVIAGNQIVDHPNNGIEVRNQVRSGGILSQALAFDANSIALASRAGIAIYNVVSGSGASLRQSLDIESNTIVDIGSKYNLSSLGGAEGIFLGTRVYDRGDASQSITIAHNQISNIVAGGYAYGIKVLNSIKTGGAVSQTLLILDNQVASVSAFNLVAGIDVVSYVSDAALSSAGVPATAASLSQFLSIASNRVADITAVQSLAVSVAPLIGRKAFGIAVGALGYYSAAINQTLSIASNEVSGVSAFLTALGVVVGNNISDAGATFSQSAAILDNRVTQVGANNTAGGIAFSDRAYYGGVIRSQTVTIAGNLVSGVAAEVQAFGIAAVNSSYSRGASISQSLAITDNTVSGIVGSASAIGIVVANTAYYHGVISQSLDISRNTVANVSYDSLSKAGGIGILLFNSASSGTIVQDLPISANSITGVGDDGIRLENHVTYSLVSQTGAIVANFVTSNGGVGLELFNSATGAGSTLFISLGVTGNNLSFDDGGLESTATAGGGAIVNLHASLNGNTIDHNTTDGIFVGVSGAGASQSVSLGSSDTISFNTGFGVHLVNLGGGSLSFITDGATITGNSAGNFTGP